MLPFLFPLLSPNHPHPPTTSGGPGGYLIQGSLRLHTVGRGEEGGAGAGAGAWSEPSPLPFLGGGWKTGMPLAGRPWPEIRRSKEEKIRGEAGGTAERSSSWCLLRAGLTQNALPCHLAISAHFAALLLWMEMLGVGVNAPEGRNALVSRVNTLMHLDSTT